MMVAGLGEDDVLKYLDRVSEGRATIACVNSPSNVTLSGDASGINQLSDILDSEGIFARKLKVETAYHSQHMRLIADTYLRFIKDISILPTSETSDVKMFSSVTGQLIEGNNLGPQYWVDNLVSKVKFAQALISLSVYSVSKYRHSRGQRVVDMFLEVGPHSALRGPVKETLQVNDAKSLTADYTSMLLRDNDAVHTALDAVGRLLTRGYPVNVAQVNMPHAKSVENEPSLVDLPSYPWNRSASYWFEPSLSTGHRLRKHGRQDLLGAPVANSSNLEPQWRGFLRTSENPWIDDHKVSCSFKIVALVTVCES